MRIQWTLPNVRSTRTRVGTETISERLANVASVPLPESAVADDDRVESLMDFWSSHRRPNGLPDRAAFDPLNLAPWLGYISVYECVPERDDFLNRLEGSYIAELTGENWVGHYASEVDRRFGSTFRADLAAVCAAREPAADAVQIFQKDFGTAYRLMLPVSQIGSDDVDQVFVAIFSRNFHPSILI